MVLYEIVCKIHWILDFVVVVGGGGATRIGGSQWLGSYRLSPVLTTFSFLSFFFNCIMQYDFFIFFLRHWVEVVREGA